MKFIFESCELTASFSNFFCGEDTRYVSIKKLGVESNQAITLVLVSLRFEIG